jgi:hypothetical protein
LNIEHKNGRAAERPAARQTSGSIFLTIGEWRQRGTQGFGLFRFHLSFLTAVLSLLICAAPSATRDTALWLVQLLVVGEWKQVLRFLRVPLAGFYKQGQRDGSVIHL